MDPTAILALILLIIFSGIFSSLEIAFFSLSQAKMDVLIKNKKKGALLAKKLKSNPEELLVTILVGNNVVNILSASIATAIAIDFFGSKGIAIATFVMTIIVLMFGEIIPKSIATKYSARIVCTLSYPLFVLQIILYPVIKSFEKTAKYLTRSFKSKTKNTVSEEELHAMAKIGVREGILEENEQLLIRNALRFNDIEVGQIMTPRVKMISINEEETVLSSMDVIKNCTFSRIPVFKDNEDNISGIFYTRDILSLSEKEYKDKKLKELSNKPLFTTETKKIDDMFKEFKIARIHIAVVLDEHGGTAGIVTLEDIIEELVGEIDDETDEKIILLKKINKNTIVVNASIEIKMIADNFDIEDFEKEDLHHSVNGYLIEHLENIPNIGDSFESHNLKFIIEKANEKMIESVRIINNTPEKE